MLIKKNMTRIIPWLVAIVTGMLVIVFPLGFFFHAYQNTSAALETEADINADMITRIIGSNPDLWKLEDSRLSQYLTNRPKGGVAEQRCLVNTKNEIVSKSMDDLPTPLIMSSSAILHSGRVVGKIEIYRSLRPVVLQTGLVFLLMFLVGLGVIFVLRTTPLRKKNEELETRVVEGTSQLEAQIDARLQAERALTESEENFREFMENAPIGIAVADMSGHIQFINRKIEEATGWTREELLSRDAFAVGLFDKETKKILLERLTARLRGDVPRTTEIPVTGKNGKRLWINLKTTILQIDGLPSGLQLAFIDVTDRKQAEESLQESEAKYKLLAEKMTDVVFIIDLNLRTIYVSPSIESQLGFTPEERIAQDVPKQVTPASLAVALDLLSKEYEREEQGQADPDRTVTVELEYYHKNGSTRWVENVMSGIRDAQGVAIGLHGVSRDITKRRQMEEAIRKSEEFYRAINENAHDLLFIVDKRGIITYMSKSVERIIGYSSDELIGTNVFDRFIPEDLPRAIEDFGQALLTKDVAIPNSFRVRHKDGTDRIMEGIGKNLLHNPSISGFVVNVRDVTEQKKAEEALRESERKYRELVDFLPIALFEMDLQGNIISGNPAIFELFGYGQNDLAKGLNALEALISTRDRDRAIETALRIFSGEKTGGTEYTGIRKDGGTFPFLNIAGPIIHGNKPVGLRGAIIDLTSQRQAEKDLQSARDMLLQSEKLASIGRLSAGVAHEILNPVNIISLELQILQAMEGLSPEVREEIKVCMNQIGRIVTITENLKAFSRIPQKKMIMANINNVIDRKSVV
jgi:PAS domain S-box-containing protein